MKTFSARRGSALLIVLGMLAFMVVSAVGFAAFMRNARLPSSYLRRTVNSRLLAKAALAEAMETIDFAIHTNAYPGVGKKNWYPRNSSEKRADSLGLTPLATDGTRTYNCWYHHIFIGTNGWMNADYSSATPSTVSTLTLEGLGYIPPPLVNEARRWSRLSTAGMWHPMRFDVGRYAFCAIDVSDYFDVNRVVADGRRDSGDSRVTLSYLFENRQHTGMGQVTPASWDQFVETQISTMPFVSVADLNLAMGTAQKSPFYRYLSGESSSFYGVSGRTSEEAERIKRMMYVTDSYIPATDTDQPANSHAVQPFSRDLSNASAASIVTADNSYNGELPSDRLSAVDLADLYDYLDKDSIPASLAIPTAERVPMIVGIQQEVAVKFRGASCEKTDSESTTQGNVTRVKETWTGKISQFVQQMQNDADVKVLAVYPFRRHKLNDDNHSYTVDASLRIFLATSEKVNEQSFTQVHPDKNAFEQTGYDASKGVFAFHSQQAALSGGSIVHTANDAVLEPVSLNFSQSINASQIPDAFQIVRWRNERRDPSTGSTTVTYEYESSRFNLKIYNASGAEVTDYFKEDDIRTLAEQNANLNDGDLNAAPLYAHAALVVRVQEGSKTVDLVPATARDDSSFLGVNNAEYARNLGSLGTIMPFKTGTGVIFSPKGLTEAASANPQVTLEPKVIYCPDPRYNYAVENWFSPSDSSSISASDWLSKCGAPTIGSDKDIFMNVSNAGYLQSIYELAYLARLCPNFELPSGNQAQDIGGLPGISGSDTFSYEDSADTVLYHDYNWRTYSPYRLSSPSQAADDFSRLGIYIPSQSLKVNPCSPNVETLEAAFANTPVEWAYAATNENGNARSYIDLDAATFNAAYAFSGLASGTTQEDNQLAWTDVEKIAEDFADAVSDHEGDWQSAFDDLGWDDTSLSSAGQFLACSPLENSLKLYGVDRKMLYGFWRDSFANRQQLFLIFVRAEPLMMGAGAVGQTPPQLGARAVALVWRNPQPPSEVNAPHEMRILFYRQFD